MNNFSHLEQFITRKMAEQRIPGAVVGVWQAGETRVAASGVTNVDCPLPVTADTLFQVGSITKTFTALLLMQLVEEGRLDLDATVQSYLPDFRVADETVSRQATIRHLLTHTAGWVGDLFEDTGEGDDASARYVALMADLPQLASLGMAYSYNNAGFYLAGVILEAVTGRFYADLLQERVLNPLGMTHSYLKPTDVMTYCYAVGHDIQGEGEVKTLRPWALPRAVYPVGGLITTVPDLLRYGRFQMGNGVTESGERLLTPESMQQIHTPQVKIWGDTE
ncbi:MAG TPA: class A beta-lactamase-related serine hydrolase, partial [Chloroflexi bacterium]|nr:class A beta-lactamase-related serine hydrolase [Chloroflexota bacterium]